MNKLIILLALTLTFSIFAKTYSVINKDSKVEFEIQKFAIGKAIEGEFKTFSGEADIEVGTLNSLNGKIVVDSINTADAKRDGHLKSGDFFAINSHPTITFKTQAPVNFKIGQERKVDALLTIKGQEKPVKVELKIIPGKKAGRYVLLGKTTIDRYDFGVTWNKRQDKTQEGILETIANFSKGLGDKYILDKNVNISFRLETIQNK